METIVWQFVNLTYVIELHGIILNTLKIRLWLIVTLIIKSLHISGYYRGTAHGTIINILFALYRIWREVRNFSVLVTVSFLHCSPTLLAHFIYFLILLFII